MCVCALLAAKFQFCVHRAKRVSAVTRYCLALSLFLSHSIEKANSFDGRNGKWAVNKKHTHYKTTKIRKLTHSCLCCSSCVNISDIVFKYCASLFYDNCDDDDDDYDNELEACCATKLADLVAQLRSDESRGGRRRHVYKRRRRRRQQRCRVRRSQRGRPAANFAASDTYQTSQKGESKKKAPSLMRMSPYIW